MRQEWPAFNRAEDEEALTQLAHTSEHTPPGFALSRLIFELLKSSVWPFGEEKKNHRVIEDKKMCFVSYSWLPYMYLVFLFFIILSCVFVTSKVLEIEHFMTISYSFNINVILQIV